MRDHRTRGGTCRAEVGRVNGSAGTKAEGRVEASVATRRRKMLRGRGRHGAPTARPGQEHQATSRSVGGNTVSVGIIAEGGGQGEGTRPVRDSSEREGVAQGAQDLLEASVNTKRSGRRHWPREEGGEQVHRARGRGGDMCGGSKREGRLREREPTGGGDVRGQ